MILAIRTEGITRPALPSPITSFLSAEGTCSDYKSDFKIIDDECHLTTENFVHKKLS